MNSIQRGTAACAGAGRAVLLSLLAGISAGWPLASSAVEPGAHVHGAAELRVAVDGGRLDIALESPLDNLLGFEHAPADDRQRDLVRAMAARLRRAQTLFVPDAAAGCTLQKVTLASAALSAALLGEPTAAAAGAAAAEPEGHADLDADFGYLCSEPDKLTGMQVSLQRAFPGLKRLNVQVVGPRGQSATLLNGGSARVKW